MCLPQALLPFRFASLEFGCRDSRLVGLDGLEPSTSRLSGVRSSHLSYRPVFLRYFSSSISLLLLSSPLAVLSNRSAGFRTFNSTSSSCWSSLGHTASAISLYGNAVDRNWWRWRDSNPWPPACRAGALPTELHPHIWVCSSGLKLNPDNWTTKSICTTRNTHLPGFLS